MRKKTSNAGAHFESMFGVRASEQIISGFKLIPHDKIKRGAQPRQSFPQEEIDELADSIRSLRERGEGIEGTGILQPLLVTEKGDGYRLIAGERRYRASAQAGVTQIPAVIVAADEKGILLAQIVENLQRRDLPALEEARGLDLLMKEQKLSLREAAHAVGKGKGYVENRINLLKMAADVQEMVSVRTDSLLHARDIDALTDAKLRAELIRAVLDEGLSRSELRRRIDAEVAPKGGAVNGGPANKQGEQGREGSDDEVSVRTDSKTKKNPQGDSWERPLLDAIFDQQDLFQSTLHQAVTLLSEFKERTKTMDLTFHSRDDAAKQLGLLKREIREIEKNLKSNGSLK